MNIIVTDRKAEQFHFRPDNTLVKDSANFYMPTFLSGLGISFGYAFRIEKPAKGVASKYSSRYINRYAEGVILYGVLNNTTALNSYNTSETSFDNSTYIVYPMKNICDSEALCDTTLSLDRSLSLICNGKEYLPQEEFPNLETIAGEMLEKFSAQFSFKTGDIIFIESSRVHPLITPCEIRLFSNQTTVLEFKVI